MSKGIWSDHLVRRFTRDNSLRVLNGEEAYTTRESSPAGMAPTSLFTGRSTLVFRDLDGYYRGGGLVTYTCLSPSKLFKNINVEVWLYNPRTLREIAAEVGRRYGVAIDPTWVVDGAFDHTTLPKTVTLSFMRTDFTISDELTVTVHRADASIPDVFTNIVLESPRVPFTYQDGRINAEFAYKADFTPANDEELKLLKAYPTSKITALEHYRDNLTMPVLADLIATRLEWTPQYEVVSGLVATDVCFRGSQLVYNGRTTGFVPPAPHVPKADTWYDNVLVVQFDATYSGVQGLAFFHYNNLG